MGGFNYDVCLCTGISEDTEIKQSAPKTGLAMKNDSLFVVQIATLGLR